MNAGVGITSPGLYRRGRHALNLHETFCISDGGGGRDGTYRRQIALAPFVPGYSVVQIEHA